jgi:hypothetical protein
MAGRSKWAEVERLLGQRTANWPWLPPSLRPQEETPDPEPWWLVALYLSPALAIFGLSVWGVVRGFG